MDAAPPRLIVRRFALWAMPLVVFALVFGAPRLVLAPSARDRLLAPGPTPTPFRPLPNTPVPTATAAAVPQPEPTLPAVAEGWRWWGLDFAPGAAETRVTVAGPGRALEITIRPGEPCQYWDHRACVSLHQARGAPLLLASVHSGLGGEAESLRFAVEGMGLNRAAVPLGEVQARLASYQGAEVTLSQENLPPANLRVLAALRIPAGRLEEYFTQPFDTAVDLAATLEDSLSSALGRPLLVIETCGWRHPEEAWAPGLTDTSGAVYLLVLGE